VPAQAVPVETDKLTAASFRISKHGIARSHSGKKVLWSRLSTRKGPAAPKGGGKRRPGLRPNSLRLGIADCGKLTRLLLQSSRVPSMWRLRPN
jgi:hypothetical protein